MSPSPWLEVVCAPSGSGLEAGQRLDVSGALGRSRDNAIYVHLSSIGRRHCRFGVDRGRPWVEDLRSTNGTFVNGVLSHGRVPLSAGDCIEIPWGVVLRVSGARPLAFDRTSELVRTVVDAPHEDGPWKVWSDLLLEQGHPLGERIARGSGADAADEARALGPMARDFVDGGFEIEWRHGFMRRAVLRNRRQWPPTSWLLEWKQLLQHPLTYFVEELELDALSYTRGIDGADREDVVSRIVASLEQLALSPRLPLLKSMRFGPSPRHLWNPQLEGAWRRATEAHPTLRTGPIWVAREAWLQLLATPPGVTVVGLDVGAQRKLLEDAQNLVGSISDCAFVLDAPDGSAASGVGLRLDRENGLWVAEDITADLHRGQTVLNVNGRPGSRHRIRPRDLLEPAPGLLFRFVME